MKYINGEQKIYDLRFGIYDFFYAMLMNKFSQDPCA